MADEQTTGQMAEKQAKGKKRLPLWIGVIIVVEIVAAMAVVKILVPPQASDDAAAWEANAEVVERDIESVIVNLMDEGAKRILRVHVTFRIRAEKPDLASAAIHRPGVVEDRLISLLCRKSLREVRGRQTELKAEIRTMINREILTPEWRKENGEAKVVELLLPEFVIQ